MPSFLKRIAFFLSGGIPSTSAYEHKMNTLVEKYRKHEQLKCSEDLRRYRALAVQVATPRRQSGLSKVDFTAMKNEFRTLRKSADVVDFFALQKKTNNFKGLSDWEVTFSDDFEGNALDLHKWITHPSLAGRLPDMVYSPANERHIVTDGKNVSVLNNLLKLTTKREAALGLAFSGELGFIPVERNFTSAVVTSGTHHMQQYGKLEVRLRFTQSSKYVYHSVWLGAGKLLPHINLVRIGSKLEFSAYAESGGQNEHKDYVEKWSRGLLRQNIYYIFALEWDEKSIAWFVNGVKMGSAPNVSREPMFVSFSSGVLDELNTDAHSALEVDWVKFYKRREVIKL
jgi:beta-glucanase (GH16 family)